MQAQLAPPTKLQDVVSRPVNSRLDVFERMCKNIPTNEFGLPRYLLRADLIPVDIENQNAVERRQTLDAAAIPIVYREGYPTLENGIPLWGRFNDESHEDHVLFEAYLSQLSTNGFRQLHKLYDMPAAKQAGPEYCVELFIYNSWAVRARAFDLFIAAAHRKQMEQRLMHVEDYQFLESDRYLKKIKDNEEAIFSKDKLEAMEPDKAVRMLKDLMGIQRQAVGLDNGSNGRGKADANDPPKNASMEVTLRTIAKTSGGNQSRSEDENRGNSIQELLKDPVTVGMAQELIVRLTYNEGVGRGQDRDIIDVAPAAEVQASRADVQDDNGRRRNDGFHVSRKPIVDIPEGGVGNEIDNVDLELIGK